MLHDELVDFSLLNRLLTFQKEGAKVHLFHVNSSHSRIGVGSSGCLGIVTLEVAHFFFFGFPRDPKTMLKLHGATHVRQDGFK